MTTAPLHRQLWRGIGWNSAAQLVPLVTQVLLTPYLLSRLGPTVYGIWALVLVVTTMLTSVDGGVGASLLRFFGIYSGAGGKAAVSRLAFTCILVLTAVGMAVGAALALTAGPLVALFDVPEDLQDEATFALAAVGALLVLPLVANVFVALLQAVGRFKTIAVTVTGGQVLFAAVAAILVSDGAGLRGLVLALVVQRVTVLLVLVVVARTELLWTVRPLLHRREGKEFFGFAWRTQLTSLTALVNLQADALVVAALLPVRFVGFYTIGASIAGHVRNLPLQAVSPLYAALANAHGRDQSATGTRFRALHVRWTRLVVGWGAVCSVSLWFVLAAWLGPEFASAGVVATVLTVGNTVNLATALTSCLVRVVGRPELELRYGVLVVALNIALTIPLAVAFGLYGVVVATAAAQIVGSLYFLRTAQKATEVLVPGMLHRVPRLPLVAATALAASLSFAVFSLGVRGPVAVLTAGTGPLLGIALYAAFLEDSPSRLLTRPRAARPRLGRQ